MKVVEIFYSIDGEGKRAGELTTFIRLLGCNLNCSYCDTNYAKTKDQEYTEMAIEDIIAECDKYNTDNITVTGGEPMIHKDIKYLLRALSDAGYDVNVETNGSIPLEDYFEEPDPEDKENIYRPLEKYARVWFTIDCKTKSSGMYEKMESTNFSTNFENALYKFVVGSQEDLNQARDIIKNIPLNKSNYIYLSPVFGKIEPKEIVEFMQKYDWTELECPIRVQLQLHKMIWPPEQRGV